MSPRIMGTHEIVELTEKYDSDSNLSANTGNYPPLKKKHKIEDDINKLFEAIEIGRGLGQQERRFRDSSHKSAMKRPMRVGPSQVSSIGISEQVSLKQALRGLCISQASEMAAVKKRMSRPSLASPAVSESGAIKKLYRTVVVELEGSERPLGEVKENLVEISLVPKRDGSLDVGSELLEASASTEESSRTQNLEKRKGTFVAKSQSQHNEEAKKDGDDHSSTMVLHKSDPIPETGIDVTKANERSRSKEKEEISISISQSSKSSIGEYSSTTSYSEESYYLSGSSRSGYRPHMSKDLRWEAIRSFQKQNGNLGLRHFKLLRKIGGGDIGTVYLSELLGTSCLFAVKVMDNEYLASRKKTMRAQTEKEILEILDHPFLPTLYAHFSTNKFSCLVMEYCPGGDLHVLRQKQLTKSFPEKAARFYVAEVLLALEYLHMLGVVYRDLKPENILVREDGHIMLSDFDLSLRCAVNNPMIIQSSSPIVGPTKKISSPCSESTCMDPFCLQPSWHLSCFTPRFLSAASKTRKLKPDPTNQAIFPLPQLVVEPTTARSNSFVGTHEYLAPEIIKGEGHGSAVDWWTLGIFLYELLYSRTPFKGTTNEETVSNVVSQCLKFPQCPMVSPHARDLIRRLLKKEPENRMGSTKGAVEIKGHSFFEGMNWALVRCETPPEMPKLYDWGNVGVCESRMRNLPLEFGNRGDEIEFEMF